jgi:hypothetical protein
MSNFVTVRRCPRLGFTPSIARTSHRFEQKHAAAVSEGRVKSVLDNAYFESLKLGILYWNGRQWTGTPSQNQQDP